jgi:hypothetical protein
MMKEVKMKVRSFERVSHDGEGEGNGKDELFVGFGFWFFQS